MTDVGAAAGQPRPLRADARRNYDALVAAARETFAARGSDAAIEDIAKRAGVGIGTLYRHFPRRMDLVEAVYATDIDALVAKVDEVSTLDPWVGLGLWLQAFVRYVETKRTFLTELHEALERNPDLRSSARERMAAAAGKVLERAQAAGLARTDVDSADMMALVGGMCLAAATTPGQNERLLTVVLAGVRRQDT